MSEWKESDFGKIPNKWDLKKIIDLKAEDKRAIAMGPFGSNIKAENFVNIGVPVIRGTNLNYSKYVDGEFVFLTEEKADELIGSNCKAGDLVFTHRGTIGQVCLIPNNKYPRYVISQSGMKLTVNSELIDNEFLFYFFKSEYGQFQILKYESQVGVPSISNPLTSLKEIEVPVPPLPEQKSIASILSSLDDKIDLLHRQNTTLEKMAETLFMQWFVEEAKEEWDEVELGKLIDVVIDNRGKTPPTVEFKTEYPLIEVNALNSQSCLVDYTVIRKYVTKETFDTWFRKHLKVNDIIISTVGTIGVFSIHLANKGCIAQNLVGLRSNKISSYFLYCFFKSNIETLINLDIGGVQPSIKVPHLLGLTIKLPPNELLNKFDESVENYFNKIAKNQSQIRTLTELRDTLLPKLMSGEVTIEF